MVAGRQLHLTVSQVKARSLGSYLYKLQAKYVTRLVFDFRIDNRDGKPSTIALDDVFKRGMRWLLPCVMTALSGRSTMVWRFETANHCQGAGSPKS
jgi:phage terminase large subunit-like protein